eukprot:COSAG01_NODE_54095_length_334_cov_1.072340_1_plen_22_part_10
MSYHLRVISFPDRNPDLTEIYL